MWRKPPLTKLTPLFAGAALLWAAPAQAHTFLPEGGFYDRFVEGTLVVLAYPATLLPLMALGILVTLWHLEGFLRAWPALIAGQVVGIGAAALSGTSIIPTLMAAGVIVASLAALLNTHRAALAQGAAGLIGLLAVAVSLEGHGFFELPLAIHLGILFAANLVVACSATLCRAALEQVTALWMRIVWRVAASWIAAILMLYFAFTVSS